MPVIRMSRIPRKYVTQVGWLAIETAWIDSILIGFVGYLAFINMSSRINAKLTDALVGGEGFEILLKKVDKLFCLTIPDEKLISRFERLKPLLAKAGSDRSKYIHPVWVYDPTQPSPPILVKVGRDLNKEKGTMRTAQPAEYEKLKQAVKDTRKAIAKLYQLRYDTSNYLIRVQRDHQQAPYDKQQLMAKVNSNRKRKPIDRSRFSL